jgi:UDP-GlcNAc3NAcA epimerase
VTRVLSVVGNRPQFIKSAPLSEALRNRGVEEIVLHTGQHYDRELSGIFFDELGLAPPRHRLDAGAGTHAAQTARMLPGIERTILDEAPDAVVVYGDTNSTLAGALAAVKVHVPVAHVEAGLRSFDRTMPEEVNRIVVDAVSTLLLCPSDGAVANLRRESHTEGVHQVGDVMYDASLRLGPLARERSRALADAGVEPRSYVLATIHREANVQPARLRELLDGLGRVGEPVILPAHPRTRATIDLEDIPVGPTIRLLPPLGYLDLAALASQARVVATDSGGLQKEAYWYGVPCVTLRESTEWVETVEAGWNVVAGTDAASVAAAIAEAAPAREHPPLYGDGRAAEKIADLLDTMAPR